MPLFCDRSPSSFFTSSHGDGVVDDDEGDNHEGSQGGVEAVLRGVGEAAVDEVAAAADVDEAAGVDEPAVPQILEWEWVP